MLRKGGRGIHKIAAEFGVGTGTVQRIKTELEEAMRRCISLACALALTGGGLYWLGIFAITLLDWVANGYQGPPASAKVVGLTLAIPAVMFGLGVMWLREDFASASFHRWRHPPQQPAPLSQRFENSDFTGDRKSNIRKDPRINDRNVARRALRKGDMGIQKIAKEFSVGAGTVQRIRLELEEGQ